MSRLVGSDGDQRLTEIGRHLGGLHEHRRRAHDVHRHVDARHSQRDVQRIVLRGGEGDGPFLTIEAAELEAHRIRARRQQHEDVVAPGAGHGHPGALQVGGARNHRHPGERASLGIHDAAGDGAGRGLSGCRSAESRMTATTPSHAFNHRIERLLKNRSPFQVRCIKRPRHRRVHN